MTHRVERFGLQVSAPLHDLIEEALPGTGVSADAFWQGLSSLIHDLGPKNRALLAKRDDIQKKLDDWYRAHPGPIQDMAAYKAFLTEIGYLVPEGPDFAIDTPNVDDAIAKVPGPQLVVPVMNARYALNAANARWGSLYDALYGTDAIGSLPKGSGYDPAGRSGPAGQGQPQGRHRLPGGRRQAGGPDGPRRHGPEGSLPLRGLPG